MRIFSTRLRQTLLAAAAYAALTVVMTWPIARDLTHGIPADLGDSLLNMWIMAWVADGVVAMAHGAMSFGDLWNANIFHPSTLTLTLSEHLVPLALQGAPVYLATGNIVLAYDLVFLATFALSGLGVFLFVRELTGSARAAFVAGVFYAFAPYRLGQFPHIQTISSQWMPFALYGMRRYFDTGRWQPLAWGTAAFVLQGLSTGYYLFYFAPVLLAYVLWEMATRGRLRHRSTWVAMAASGVTALLCVLPFLLPYAEAKVTFGHSRPFEEVLAYSADLYAYLNAPPQLWLWGSVLNRFPQPEGDLFFGAVPIVCGLAAIVLWLRRAWLGSSGVPWADAPALDRRARVLAALAALAFAIMAAIVLSGGAVWEFAGIRLRMTSPRRPLVLAVLLSAGLLWISPRMRVAARPRPADLTPFLILALTFAVLMSLGPRPRAGGLPLVGLNLYETFYTWVPGFDGLRAPARFAMVATLVLAVLSSGALLALARWGRVGTLALTLVAAAFLAEAYAVPMPMNLTWSSSERYAAPWPVVHRLNEGPLAYRHVLLMPAETVLLELPFGDQAWDLRYVYYAGLHGKRIVNGYSGYFPDGYQARAARLSAFWSNRGAAWTAATTAGATHLLVHERGYVPLEGPAVSTWALAHGARLVAEFSDGDKLFALPPR